MPFHIQLLPEWVPGSEVGNAGQYGEIQLGDYHETFVALIGFWSPRDYSEHWTSSIKRLVEHKRKSCLITSLHDPKVVDVIHWWLLYPVGDEVLVQNSLLIDRQALSSFATSDPHISIPVRKQVSEEGELISEWIVPLEDFRDFLRTAS